MNSKKIQTLSALKKILPRRRSGKKVVFTNGCFDILHRGHTQYLQRAKNLGDILVVALNSDASVKKLKGPSRPVNSLTDRREVLAALEAVDFVTWFGEPTPLKVITQLKPDILVKGGDWKPAQIVGSDVVLQSGGKVRSLRFLKGRSTTSILNRL